jgi:hypothetical protein
MMNEILLFPDPPAIIIPEKLRVGGIYCARTHHNDGFSFNEFFTTCPSFSFTGAYWCEPGYLCWGKVGDVLVRRFRNMDARSSRVEAEGVEEHDSDYVLLENVAEEIGKVNIAPPLPKFWGDHGEVVSEKLANNVIKWVSFFSYK